MPPDPRVHVGVAAYVEDNDQVLMIRRGGKGQWASDGSGTYAVPGGWLDFGEMPEDAAVREVLEETSVVVDAIQGVIYAARNLSYDGLFQIITLYVRCRYVSGEPTVMEPNKCPEVGWHPKEGALLLPLFKPTKDLFHHLWWPS